MATDKEQIYWFVCHKGRVRKEDVYERFKGEADYATVDRRLRELVNDEQRLKHPEPSLFLSPKDCLRFYEPVSTGGMQQ